MERTQRVMSIESRLLASFALCAGALTSVACKQAHGEARMEQAEPTTTVSAPTTYSAELSRPPRVTGVLETVPVQNDRSVLVVVGERPSRPIVYLHGMCGEARSDLEAWSSGVNAHGTVIALSGDTPCADQPGMLTWTMDIASIDRRIERALDAVRAARGLELDASELIVIGESMGATRAEALAAQFRAKYTRVVLVGAPETTSPKRLEGAKGIAIVAGENEPQEKIRRGVTGLEAAGLPVRFWELPGAIHGAYGPEGARVMSEAVASVAVR